MLTAKQNFLETIRGGNPDRFVNQYEAVAMLFHPSLMHNVSPTKGGPEVVNAWGVTMAYPDNAPGPFPVHTPEKILVKDIEEWRSIVKAPSLDFPQGEWDQCKAIYDSVDGDAFLRSVFVAPGIFEQTHYLCSMTEALLYYMTDPDEMHDMVKYLTDWELKLAEGICEHIHPEALIHHDDWGSSTSSFLRPTMFADFFLDAYKQVYGYYHDHGVDVIIHHSDSYAAHLVPYMIEMGIDVWQGPVQTNNLPELIKKYGDQIAFMGGIDNKAVDFNGWTPENNRKVVRELMEACGNRSFVPCITQGGPGSVYPGCYDSLVEEIDLYNAERFGLDVNEIRNQRKTVAYGGGLRRSRG